MSVTTTTVSNVLNVRRPNSIHLDKLLQTDNFCSDGDMSESISPVSISDIPCSSFGNTEVKYDVPSFSTFRSDDYSQQKFADDSLIYANLSEIERKRVADLIDRQPLPPIPTATDSPQKILQCGINVWHEYKTISGRSFYFNPKTRARQWVPPRSSKSQQYENECESPRKLSLHETTINSAPVELRKQSRSKSTDQSPPMDSNQGMFEAPTNFTNLLLEKFEKDMWLSKAPPPPLQSQTSSFTGTTTFTSKCPPPFSSHPLSIPSSSSFDPSNIAFPPPSSAIHQGSLDKCRILDGTKPKKNHWTTVYAFLYSGHLLFYKDQKSAEKNGKHYPQPQEVCDLRGAQIEYVMNEKFKDKRHKALISVHSYDDVYYLLSSSNDTDVDIWYRSLKKAVLSMPSTSVQPLPSPFHHGSLGRSSTKSSLFNVKNSIRQSVKNSMKNSMPKERSEDIPPKESIIDRLLRFLRSRPTMENLSERGIYRPEPVFGSTLTAVCEHDRALVPRFVTEVIQIVERKGIHVDGIYRVSGNLSSIQKLRCQIDQDKYDSLYKEEDVHVVTGALKLFLRELDEPLFPLQLNKDFMSAMRETGKNRGRIFDELLRKLPQPNRSTLSALVLHLRKVAAHSSENRMQIHNLAIVFGPALFHSEGRSPRTYRRRNSGFLSKKQPVAEPKPAAPSQNLAYKMVVFGQITEFILNEAENFQIFLGLFG